MATRYKKIIGAILIVLATVFLINAVFDYWFSSQRWPNEVFSSQTWKISPLETRYMFFNDLIKKKVLDGLSRERVVNLLGTPDYKAPDGLYTTYILKYVKAGEWSFNSVYLLHINFDTNDKVTEYFLRTD